MLPIKKESARERKKCIDEVVHRISDYFSREDVSFTKMLVVAADILNLIASAEKSRIDKKKERKGNS